jgi:thiamine-monophosphate kinase
VSDFTEDDLVAMVRKLLGGEAVGVRLGAGDDAALVEFGHYLGILTTDMLVEGVHFERSSISPRDLGHKGLTVNVSDVAAMGGSPRYGLASIGLPDDVEMPWVVELYGGMLEAAADYGMSLVGGDTNRADRVVLSMTVTGEVDPGAVVTRGGGRPGERIVVTGRLGAAAGGLLLSRVPSQQMTGPVVEHGRELLAALTRPVARVGEGQALARSGATAMIDLSDGLAKDLGRLCAQSEVGAAVRLADVPVSPGLEELRDVLGADPLDLALHGGEDYELLATLPGEAVPAAAETLWEAFATRLTEIGEIREGRGLVAVAPDGSEGPLDPKGWDHFGG